MVYFEMEHDRIARSNQRIEVQLDKNKKIYLKAEADIHAAKEKCLTNIDQVRKEINEMLDNLQKKTVEKLDKLVSDNQSQLTCYLEKITWAFKMLHNCKTCMQSSNTSQRAIGMLMSNKLANEVEDILQAMASYYVPSEIYFNESLIKNHIRSITSIGDISVVHNMTLRRELMLYEVCEQPSKKTVKIKSDKNKCNIVGSCFFNSSGLLLTDYNNKKLKFYDIIKSEVTMFCELPASPHAVCLVSNVEAALSMKDKSILFVAIGDKLTPNRSLIMQDATCGLAYACGQMYISNFQGKIFVYEIRGQLFKTINDVQQVSADSDNVPHKYIANHVAINTEGRIHVTSSSQGLQTFDSHGEFVWKNPKYISGVCTDSYVSIFVCDTSSNSVLQLDQDGQRLIKVVDGVKRPQAVCFDNFSQTLVVTSNNDENLLICHLKFKNIVI